MANDSEKFYSASLDHSIMEWELPNNLVNSNPFESYGKAISNRTKILNGHKNSVWDLCVHPTKPSLLFSIKEPFSSIKSPKSDAHDSQLKNSALSLKPFYFLQIALIQF